MPIFPFAYYTYFIAQNKMCIIDPRSRILTCTIQQIKRKCLTEKIRLKKSLEMIKTGRTSNVNWKRVPRVCMIHSRSMQPKKNCV